MGYRGQKSPEYAIVISLSLGNRDNTFVFQHSSRVEGKGTVQRPLALGVTKEEIPSCCADLAHFHDMNISTWAQPDICITPLIRISLLSDRRAKRQSSLDENAKALAVESSLRIDHTPIKLSQQDRNHLVQFDQSDMPSQAAKAARSENKFKSRFHKCETGLGGFC